MNPTPRPRLDGVRLGTIPVISTGISTGISTTTSHGDR